MAKYTLRPHQADMLEQIDAAITFGSKKLMIDACPAFGKSLLMAEVAKLFKQEGVIILINISALLDQIAEHLESQGIEFSVLKAKSKYKFDPNLPIQLIMSQTLHARRKKIQFNRKFKVYQQDEGHRENRLTSSRTAENFTFLEPEVEIAYSGTPFDQLGFKFPGYEYLSNLRAKDLEEQGFLSPIKYYIPKWSEEIDFSSIKKSGNDYNTVELDRIINTESHLDMCINSMNQMDAKNKKTLVFCSSIEQADRIAGKLQSDGYNAFAYHSKTEESEDILYAFKSNTNYTKGLATKKKASRENGISLFEDDEVLPESPVQCLVSINRLGIGFDVPDVKLGVQLRPTSVRSLYIQQVMRLARTHKSKEFSEYLDLGQTVSRFGFHTDLYSPPERSGDKDKDYKALEEASIPTALDDLNVTLSDELEEVTRDIYRYKIEEIKKSLEIPLEDMSIQKLAAAYDLSRDHKEIITIACLIYTMKFGRPVSKKGYPYDYRPENFWSASTFGDPKFHVPYSMDEYFAKYPDQKTKWIKALKTRCRNIIKEGKNLFAITGFIKFLADKYEEENEPLYAGTIYEQQAQSNYHKDNEKYKIPDINDISEEEIPF